MLKNNFSTILRVFSFSETLKRYLKLRLLAISLFRVLTFLLKLGNSLMYKKVKTFHKAIDFQVDHYRASS